MTQATIISYITKNFPLSDSRASVRPNISSGDLTSAVRNIAIGIPQDSIVGIINLAVFGRLKNGFVFTDDLIYAKGNRDKTPQKHNYQNLAKVQRKDAGSRSTITVMFNNNSSIEILALGESADEIFGFFEGLIELVNSNQSKSGENNSPKISTSCTGCGAGYVQAAGTGARCEWCDTSY